MRIAILGLGAAGGALARALVRPGLEVALASRDPERARALAASIGAESARGDDEAAQGADVVVFAVHEAGLDERARALAASDARPKAALHLAGSLGPEALAPLRHVGIPVGTLHPLVALRPGSRGEGLRGASWAIAGEGAALRAARSIVERLDGRALTVQPGCEMTYHAGAALLAGGAVALFDAATDALAASIAGDDARREARLALSSLLASVAENLGAVEPSAALTGPVARGASETVEAHLRALESWPEVLAYYRGVLPRMERLAAAAPSLVDDAADGPSDVAVREAHLEHER